MQAPQKQQSRDTFFAELSAAAQAKAEAERNAGHGSGGGSRSTGLGSTGRGSDVSRIEGGRIEGGRIDAGDAWPQDIRDLGGLRPIQDILAPPAASAAQTAQNARVAHGTDRRSTRRRVEDAEDGEDSEDVEVATGATGAPGAPAPWIRPDWMTQERSPLDRSTPPPLLPMRGTGERAAAAAEPTGGAGLAHDASNLLAALMLYSELLAMPGVLAESHRHYADDLNLLGERCQRLIDRLVAFGGAVDREREQPAARTQVSLVDVLMRCEGLLSTLARRSLQISFGPQAALPVAIAPEPLERILVNLVKNATQATSQGGAVRIGVGLQADPEPGETTARPHSPRGEAGQGGVQGGLQTMVLTVDDSGCGMTEAQIERVLQPAAPIGDGRRQGIGLRVVRELVTASGGQLRILSRAGIGTRVEIRWPVFSGEAASAVSQPASQMPPAATGMLPGRIAHMEMIVETGGDMPPGLAAGRDPAQNARPDHGPRSTSGCEADLGRDSTGNPRTDSRLGSVPVAGELTAAERRLLESHGRAGKGAVTCSPGFHQSRKGAIAC